MEFAGATIDVIDTDTHLTEPPDLWTSRLPKKWQAECPRIEEDRATGDQRWRIGDRWLVAPGTFSCAGWPEFPPSYPRRWEDVNPACYDASKRLEWMDKYQIHAQVLYPNILAFEGHAIMALDPELQHLCIRAYNDYQVEFGSATPGRFVPIAMLPFWDLEETLREMERCRNMGHRGLVWAAQMEKHGLPGFSDPYWDRVYALAQDLEMSINFHIGVGATEDEMQSTRRKIAAAGSPGGGEFDVAADTMRSSLHFMSNTGTIAEILTGGLCDRFPKLNFVSVESGFGYIPYLVEILDWQWRGAGGPQRLPDRLLPSEYFRRQVYTMFWFEQTTLPLLSLFPDNVMFETDFPHKTSLSPGPGSASPDPDSLIRENVAAIGMPIMKKVLYENAARLYHLD